MNVFTSICHQWSKVQVKSMSMLLGNSVIKLIELMLCVRLWIHFFAWLIVGEKCWKERTSVQAREVLQCNFNSLYTIIKLPSVLWHCWLGGRKGIRPVKKLSGGVLAWLSVWSEVQTCTRPSWCHCHSLSLASVKSTLVLPFWHWFTWVVPDKGPFNGCVYIYICMYVYITVKY